MIVTIEHCPGYYDKALEPALERVLEPLGGMEKFVRPGQTVLLKPNLLRRARPEEAVTTHPALVRAVAVLVKRAGGKAVIGDSPGAAAAHTRNTLVKLYRACGMDRAADETGVELALDTGHRVTALPRGRIIKKSEIIQPALDADVIINLPKFKTHSFTLLTGAVKNLFGLVPGLLKPAYHARFPDVNDFSSMLVDLAEFAAPALTITDGIWGMEGNGPGAGDRRDMGLIVAGEGPAAVDVVLSRIMGIDPLSIPTTRQCVERGLLNADLSGIEVRGEDLASVVQKGFRIPPGRAGAFPAWTKPFMPVAKYLLSTRPRIVRKNCVGCGDCVRVCPVKTISLTGGKAAIHLARCIRCYCCHETCVHRAIDLVKPLFQRIFV
ncbi:MAG: DUF362 domain-containing protein [PVC group bacterium]